MAINDRSDEQNTSMSKMSEGQAGRLTALFTAHDPIRGEIFDRDAYGKALALGVIGEITSTGRSFDRNIIFVGEGEPATEFHGAFKVKLPDAETQRKGFYHEKAAAIIRHRPKLYKKFVRKGYK